MLFNFLSRILVGCGDRIRRCSGAQQMLNGERFRDTWNGFVFNKRLSVLIFYLLGASSFLSFPQVGTQLSNCICLLCACSVCPFELLRSVNVELNQSRMQSGHYKLGFPQNSQRVLTSDVGTRFIFWVSISMGL